MNIKKLVVNWIIPVGILIILIATGISRLGRTDMAAFTKWWLVLLLLGVAFYPLSALIFQKFHDKGWLFSKTIGIAVCGWLMWYLASMKILKFTVMNCYISIGICLVLNILLAVLVIRKERKNTDAVTKSVYALSEDSLHSIFISELIFFAFFLFWTYLVGCNAKAYGTEKFMDFGFLTSMMRTEYMPPEDFWMAGEKLNYYYVGQYLIVYLTKVSGVTVSMAYNIGLMMLAGFAFALPYSLMYQVAKEYSHIKLTISKKARTELKIESGRLFPVIIGVVSGIAVSLSGNMHYPTYKWFIPRLRELIGLDPLKAYWFPDATRYIGYNPETTDKTIHEFPLYSFVLGDLHAHVINIIFVITVLALLFAILQMRKSRMDAIRSKHAVIEAPAFISEVFQPAVIMIGFFIGLFHTTNYWDYPIYFVVSGAIILFSNAVLYRFKLKCLWLTAAHAVVIIVVAQFTCLPFTISFDKIASSILPTVASTPIHQLIVLWGLPIVTVITFLCVLVMRVPAIRKKNIKSSVVKDETPDHEIRNGLFRLIDSLQISDLFVITMGLCAIGLILIPEVIYVKDIYSGDYKRANTMFKLTYQAYIMFGMCMGYILIRFIRFRETMLQTVFGVILLSCLVMTTFYFGNASKAWFGDYVNKTEYEGLGAMAYLEEESKDDYLAISWLNENVKGKAVIVEEAGNGYTFHQRVSVNTGLSTVLGWNSHEWLWRSDESGAKPAVVDERVADITTLYTSVDSAAVKAVIDKYDIDYIYVGEGETVDGTNSSGTADETHTVFYHGYYYPPVIVNNDLLRSLGEVVFESPATVDKTYATYIVKVEHD